VKTNKSWIFLCLLSCAVGILVGKILFIPGISIQREINPVHALSIISTLFVAIVISILFAQEKDKNKGRKEIVLNRVCAGLEICDSLFGKINDNKIEHSQAVSIFKRIGIVTKCVFYACNKIELKLTMNEDKFNEQAKRVKDLMTNTPIIPENVNTPPIKTTKGIVEYNSNRIAEIETELEKLRNMFLELQIDIIAK
jgi:hypothetical protein